MKKLKKIMSTLVFCLIAVCMLNPMPIQAAPKIKLNKTNITVYVGKTYKLEVKGTKKVVRWSSSNKKVATVTSKGKITGTNPGTTTIRAKVGNKSLKCKVKVKSILAANKTSVRINIGKKAKVKITFIKKGSVSYKISNPSIVSCSWGDFSGNTVPLTITAKESGSTTITISNSYSKEKIKIKVTVTGNSQPGGEETTNEYGTVSGNVSYYYNKYFGHRADTGAKVILIPKDGSALKATSIYGSSYIFTGEVDGIGNYSIQHVPVGRYRLLLISKGTTEGAWYNAESQEVYYDSIAQAFYPTYMTKDMANAMVKQFVFYQKWYIVDVTVYNNENTVISHDFGMTYM